MEGVPAIRHAGNFEARGNTKLDGEAQLGRFIESQQPIDRPAGSFVWNSRLQDPVFPCLSNAKEVERKLICRFGVLDFRDHILASMVVCARGSRNSNA